jgi:hypothetical protein
MTVDRTLANVASCAWRGPDQNILPRQAGFLKSTAALAVQLRSVGQP